MNTPPFASNYGTNTTVLSADINSFLIAATTNPTSDTGSYARYQKIGTLVQVEFRYKFLTTPTGAMSINIPLPINQSFTKPQSIFHIRYFNSPGTGKVYYGFYNENTISNINLVAPTTFGGVPASLTESSPETLVIGDVLSGLIFYETI
jgi:hypothetical protein